MSQATVLSDGNHGPILLLFPFIKNKKVSIRAIREFKKIFLFQKGLSYFMQPNALIKI